MPKGVYPRKNGNGKHAVTDPDTDYLRKVCAEFLDKLPHPKIVDESLFTILDEEARKRGYQIAARQMGIRGTFISFTPPQ